MSRILVWYSTVRLVDRMDPPFVEWPSLVTCSCQKVSCAFHISCITPEMKSTELRRAVVADSRGDESSWWRHCILRKPLRRRCEPIWFWELEVTSAWSMDSGEDSRSACWTEFLKGRLKDSGIWRLDKYRSISWEIVSRKRWEIGFVHWSRCKNVSEPAVQYWHVGLQCGLDLDSS
jgi:hypothetical protein